MRGAFAFRKKTAAAAALLLGGLLSGCLFDNRENALEFTDRSTELDDSSPSTNVGTNLLELPAAVLERTCPSASVFVESELSGHLDACMGCHRESGYLLSFDESSTDERLFETLLTYIESYPITDSDNHILVARPSGVSHTQVWSPGSAPVAAMAAFLDAEQATPCDRDAAFAEAVAAAEALPSPSPSSSESAAPDEPF